MENIAKTGGETKQNINDLSYSIHHWGPLLFKIKMLPQDLKSLKKLCSKSNENWGKNLAGIIKDEFKIDSAKYIKIITPYLKAYQQAYLTWYGLNLKKVEVTAAWVNYMKAGEGNPPHIHHNCHLSSVIILSSSSEHLFSMSLLSVCIHFILHISKPSFCCLSSFGI